MVLLLCPRSCLPGAYACPLSRPFTGARGLRYRGLLDQLIVRRVPWLTSASPCEADRPCKLPRGYGHVHGFNAGCSNLTWVATAQDREGGSHESDRTHRRMRFEASRIPLAHEPKEARWLPAGAGEPFAVHVRGRCSYNLPNHTGRPRKRNDRCRDRFLPPSPSTS